MTIYWYGVGYSNAWGVRLKFQREDTSIYEEMKPLTVLHYEEIAHYQDIPLEPDIAMYKAIEEQGMLRLYTVRDEEELIGYSIFFIKENCHYKSSVQASQDIVFIRKDKRGQGREFLAWCDSQLKQDGVEVVYHHVKAAHNFGPLLVRQGYELVDYIYGKRL